MMQLEGFSIAEACRATGLSRAGFYRNYEEHEPRQADIELRDAIHKIVIENRFYGYRRVTAALNQKDWAVNRKRVLRLMRADNLLALRKRRYVLTTDSRHPFAIYPNLVPRLVVNGINQLWVSDITYIRLRETFLYLAVVLDAHSRKAVGWELGDTLEASLAIEALRHALADRSIEPGMVHHSDRGVQYTSIRYTQRLADIGAVRSVGSKGDSCDNAAAEAVNSLCKKELINHEGPWQDAGQVTMATAEWVSWYNDDRLHSACGNIPPAEYENALMTRKGHVIIMPEAKAS